MKSLSESAGIRKQRANHKRLPKFKDSKREPVLYKRPDGKVVTDKSAESVIGLRVKPSKKKKQEIKNARQSENSSARIALKKETSELVEEAANAVWEDKKIILDFFQISPKL